MRSQYRCDRDLYDKTPGARALRIEVINAKPLVYRAGEIVATLTFPYFVLEEVDIVTSLPMLSQIPIYISQVLGVATLNKSFLYILFLYFYFSRFETFCNSHFVSLDDKYNTLNVL